MRVDKDYVNKVGELSDQALAVAGRLRKRKRLNYGETQFFAGHVFRGAQKIMSDPGSLTAHVDACACVNIAFGFALTIEDVELIDVTCPLKDLIESHFKEALQNKEEGDKSNEV